MRLLWGYQGIACKWVPFPVCALLNGWEQSCWNDFCSIVPSFCLAQMDQRMVCQLNIPPAVPPTAQQARTVALLVRSGIGTVSRFSSHDTAKRTIKYKMPVNIPQKNLREREALPAINPPNRQAIT